MRQVAKNPVLPIWEIYLGTCVSHSQELFALWIQSLAPLTLSCVALGHGITLVAFVSLSMTLEGDDSPLHRIL